VRSSCCSGTGGTSDNVDRLTHRDDFPEPEAELMGGRVWKREAIEKWARATGREILEH
jgi:hypothetical protein